MQPRRRPSRRVSRRRVVSSSPDRYRKDPARLCAELVPSHPLTREKSPLAPRSATWVSSRCARKGGKDARAGITILDSLHSVSWKKGCTSAQAVSTESARLKRVGSPWKQSSRRRSCALAILVSDRARRPCTRARTEYYSLGFYSVLGFRKTCGYFFLCRLLGQRWFSITDLLRSFTWEDLECDCIRSIMFPEHLWNGMRGRL